MHFRELSERLAKQFGGVTSYTRAPATGLWQARGRRLTRDDVILFEVMSVAINREWWRRERRRLEKLFRQDHIVVRSQRISAL